MRRVALLLALGWARHAAAYPGDPKLDEFDNAPPKTKPELILHEPGDDLSASRLDCEVFGWNRRFTEVAAVGSDTRRGPRGKHRGEVFLLVYALGQTLPLHNVIAHNITHPDLPHDPIPIEDARDLTWAIENSYLDMWPVRPRRKRPKQAMQVEVMWDPLRVANGLCTPLVGFALHHRGLSRFQQFMPVDMQVDCRNLRQSDARVYWGKDDVAAAMVRFDFPLRDSNERSARFVVSAAWQMARELNIVVMGQQSVPPRVRSNVLRELRKLGAVHFGGSNGASDDPSANADAAPRRSPVAGARPGVVSVRTKEAYLDLGRWLGRTFFAGRIGPIDDDLSRLVNGFPDVIVQLGMVPPTQQMDMAAPTAPPPAEVPAAPAAEPSYEPADSRYVPAPMPSDLPQPKQLIPRAPPPPPMYLEPIDKGSDSD